jgi:oligopeptide/dipeptide ABC transporter ATP-binding protein
MEIGNADQILRHSANPYTKALIACAMTQGNASRMPYIPGRAIDLRLEWQGCPFAPRCAFVQPTCRTQAPPAVEVESGHVSRCHFAREVQAHRESAPA